MISGAIFRSDKIISHDSGLTIWFWFSTISGVVLNFSFSVPSQFKIFQKSIFISGLYSISLIARDIYQLLLLSFIDEKNPYKVCTDFGCQEFTTIEKLIESGQFWFDSGLVIAAFFLSFINLSFSVIMCSLFTDFLLKYIKHSFNLNYKTFQTWRKIVIGALSLGGLILIITLL